ncbi:o-succinylbenzoate--CoA ligase [Priestia megaterium]|nr:o-succinylbenzoate--CoA ligase [Priestia megaterium]
MDARTLPNWLKQRATLTPNRIAIETDRESLTFLELHQRVARMARKLANYGVKSKDTVAVFMRNSVHYVEIIHALAYLGAKGLLVNTRLTNQEINYQVKDASVSLLISDESIMNRSLHMDVAHVTLSELVDFNQKDVQFRDEFRLDEAYTIMYTSGTTGSPKGVLQTYGNHWWSATGAALNLGLYEQDCWLIAVPLFHISGFSILMRSVIYGMKVILHEKFDPTAVNDAIEKKGVTIVSVVTSMLTAMIEKLDHRTYPHSFRCMLLGGGPAPLTLLNHCVNKGIPVYQTYGMTETASQFVTLSSEDSLRKIGSAGKPLFPCQLKIVDKQGKVVRAGQPGEIIVKGPNVTPGYFNKPKETKGAIKKGWFYTGDIGQLDHEGFLYVLDRRSDLIISGGENIYPAEIENVLLKHPAVKEAGVTGMKHEKWGQVPIAFVVITKQVSADELRHHSEQLLARYKVPLRFTVVDKLPRTASNKIIRKKLLELLEEDDH